MKEVKTLTYVQVLRHKRKLKIYTSDLKRIFKVEKRITPKIPLFKEFVKFFPPTDVEDSNEENIGVKSL